MVHELFSVLFSMIVLSINIKMMYKLVACAIKANDNCNCTCNPPDA